MKYFKRIRSENIKLNMCRNRVWHAFFILRIKTWKTKTSKLRRKRSTQLLRECWSFLKKLMTCQNLQNNLLNITVLFIWYLLSSLKKMSLVAILASVWKKWFPTLQMDCILAGLYEQTGMDFRMSWKDEAWWIKSIIERAVCQDKKPVAFLSTLSCPSECDKTSWSTGTSDNLTVQTFTIKRWMV